MRVLKRRCIFLRKARKTYRGVQKYLSDNISCGNGWIFPTVVKWGLSHSMGGQIFQHCYLVNICIIHCIDLIGTLLHNLQSICFNQFFCSAQSWIAKAQALPSILFLMNDTAFKSGTWLRVFIFLSFVLWTQIGNNVVAVSFFCSAIWVSFFGSAIGVSLYNLQITWQYRCWLWLWCQWGR